jgi:hypothetical protein
MKHKSIRGSASAGQVLFSRGNPTQVLSRSANSIFQHSKEFTGTSHSPQKKTFNKEGNDGAGKGSMKTTEFVSNENKYGYHVQSMVYFEEKWHIYYQINGTALSVAVLGGYDYSGRPLLNNTKDEL